VKTETNGQVCFFMASAFQKWPIWQPCKHSLRLSIEKNPFPAKNQTLRCYRVNISPTKVASSALRNA